MLYLVIGRAEEINGPLLATQNYFPQIASLIEGVYNPSFEIIDGWIREGRARGGLFAGERGGAFIIEASSNEEIAGILSSLPMWGLVNWEVKPMQSFRSGIDMNQRNVNEMKNMMNK